MVIALRCCCWWSCYGCGRVDVEVERVETKETGGAVTAGGGLIVLSKSWC